MQILDWKSLSLRERERALERPAFRPSAQVESRTREIIGDVRARGDAALLELTAALDGARLTGLEVTEAEYETAERSVSDEARAALDRAIDSIQRFHAAQLPGVLRVETAPGVKCERWSIPIRAVGLYVPAGSAPLPSSALMLAIPSRLAGCPVRVLCTPPRRDGTADPAVLVAARKGGIERIFKVGGAQAIAAMAYGTESIPRCDKLFGPGNRWVSAAKRLVAMDPAGAAIDLPAGPSEVLVVADERARADFVAADLLAQAEHGPDAQALLVASSRALAIRVAREIVRQQMLLSRRAILAESIGHLRLIVVEDLDQAMTLANRYAPEHLMLAVREPRALLSQVQAAGSVFLGPWSIETLGDYCAGPNHTLPTFGSARAVSGLGVEDFQKRIAVQEVSAEGLRALGDTARVLASLEGLDGHAAAVSVRLVAIEGAER